MAFLTSLCSCFTSQDREEEAVLAGDIHLPPAYVKRCVFCNVSREKGFDILHEVGPDPNSDDLIVFRDRAPAATEHLLAIPRHHLASVKALGKDDIQLVRNLQAASVQAFTELGFAPENQKLVLHPSFGFHVPPFNLINHLHLHCFGLPFRPSNEWKFHVALKQGGKGFSWFVEIGQVYEILGKGGKVKVLSC
ncbi:hypothetical protein DACRYDRAFT_114103 [Dacryopinax primogenitus]|uniref:HIT domain-containing protein n=1 Tax=Dacryopinax primogenitus (strain DJM 731) TaxID=1858805 RepID=M5G3H5_DACPD|nr:uncharacterized protein DACRYDRAFT_114103 [Dacryopinax primogenitus]EJU04776.1 hypothetical protein DACRYDRAFT_114103 [Dacryopinax primogenitus]